MTNYSKVFDAEELIWNIVDVGSDLLVATANDEWLADLILSFCQQRAGTPTLQPIIVTLEDGLIGDIFVPAWLLGQEIYVVDYDTEARPTEDMTHFSDGGVTYEADVRHYNQTPLDDSTVGIGLVREFLKAQGQEEVVDVEFLVAYKNKTWEAVSRALPVVCTITNEQMQDWFKENVLPGWSQPNVVSVAVLGASESRLVDKDSLIS